MYGSYGSYSSMCAAQTPGPFTVDMLNTTYMAAAPQGSTCAFPSWPRRSSLSECDEERATSFLSDEDLFPHDVATYEDDVRSISSADSLSSPISTSPCGSATAAAEAQLEHMQRQAAEQRREVMRFLLSEKERRRQQQASRRPRRASGSGSGPPSKKSPKTKLSAMTPIAEAGGE